MTATRLYALADILTMTTGRLLAPRGMDAVYDLANWMTDDNLMTHQLPRAIKVCGPALLEQLPHLRGVEPPATIDATDIPSWIADAEREYGETLPVAPLPSGVWEYRDPIEELTEMVGPEKIIPVIVTGTGTGDGHDRRT